MNTGSVPFLNLKTNTATNIIVTNAKKETEEQPKVEKLQDILSRL
ncbi:42966_t:CDS:1, partial [Gigaspora margarita]